MDAHHDDPATKFSRPFFAGVHPQVTAVHIYRLTYRFLISSVLYPLRGIPRGVSGWSLTPYSHLQMGQLGQTIKKMEKLR